MKSLAVCALIASLVACSAKQGDSGPPPSSGPFVLNPGSTLAFSPSGVWAYRFAYPCGVADPPYDNRDIFGLQAGGDPDAGFFIYMPPTVTVGIAYAIELGAPSPDPPASQGGQYGTSADGTVQFDYHWGVTASQVDASALDSATVTVEAFPAEDGDALTVRVVLHFVDGGLLDATGSADTPRMFYSCPAG